MNPNIAVGYLAEQISVDRRDGEAARGWQAEQAAATRSQRTVPASQLAPYSVALHRVGNWLRLRGRLRQALRRPIAPEPGTSAPALSEI